MTETSPGRRLMLWCRGRLSLVVAGVLMTALTMVPSGIAGLTGATFTSVTGNNGSSYAAAGSFATYSQAVLADNPSCYFRLGEALGSTNAPDSSGHGCGGNYLSPDAQFPGCRKPGRER